MTNQTGSRAGRWAGSCLVQLCLAAGVQAASAAPPNIVFILADDLDKGSFEQMPRLRALLTEQGARFEQHFVSLSLCCPSRSATLRGQFAANTGMYGNEYPGGGYELFHTARLEDSTVATWLQSAGYRTALIGKYMNGYPLSGARRQTYIPPGWTEWYSPVDGTPYESYNYSMNQNGTVVPYGSLPQDHITDVSTGLAVDFINRHRADHPEQAFFLYLSPYAPHGPATPPPRYLDALPGLKAPRTPSFNEQDVSDKPRWVRSLPRLTGSDIARINKVYADKRRSMLAVEDMVQQVLDALAAQGQLENTYVLFASDNGFHFGEHRLQPGKATGYHEDLNVPLVVRGPGVAPGRVVTQLTANVDYASTLAEMAGVAPPDFVDGRSLMPLLRGQGTPVWRHALLLEYAGDAVHAARRNGTEEPPDPAEMSAQTTRLGAFRGLRTDTGLTYLEYDTLEFELYDHTIDPYQLVNSYDSAPSELRSSLANWTAKLQSSAGAALRAIEERTVGR